MLKSNAVKKKVERNIKAISRLNAINIKSLNMALDENTNDTLKVSRYGNNRESFLYSVEVWISSVRYSFIKRVNGYRIKKGREISREREVLIELKRNL